MSDMQVAGVLGAVLVDAAAGELEALVPEVEEVEEEVDPPPAVTSGS